MKQSIFRPGHPRFATFIALAVLGASAAPVIRADEVDLKALKSLDTKESSSESSYVGIFGGATSSQSANVVVEGNSYSINPDKNAAFIGFEIGKRWRAKKAPLEFGAEFEGAILATQLEGTIDNPAALATRPDPTTGLTAFDTEMNSALFLLNGTVALDLRRYQPYIGKHLSRVKPYAGAGIGGAQLWFRESVLTPLGDGNPATTEIPTSNLFTSDAFVFAHQFFAGMEYKFGDKVAAFAEYRQLGFASFDEDVSDYENSIWNAGLRMFYDKENDR